MKNQFSTPEVAMILDIDITRFYEWLRRGNIEPSIKAAGGRGVRNVFSRYDIYRVSLFKTLLEAGFQRKITTGIIKNLKDKQFEGETINLYNENHMTITLDVRAFIESVEKNF